MATEPTTLVRCTDCRYEYVLPPRGEEVVCPACGSTSWVSSLIPAEPPDAVRPK